MVKKKKTRRFWILGSRGLDTNLIVITMFLLVFGLIMVYSASYYKAGLGENADSMSFLKSQALYAFLGILGMLVVSNINYHFWKKRWVVTMAGTVSVFLILLLLTRFFGDKHPLNLTNTVNGATRWLKVGGVSLQVAEVVKVAVIVITAWVIDRMNLREIHYWKKFTKYHWGISFIILLPGVGLAALLGKISNNMSTALIIIMISMVMYFAWHPKTIQFYAMIPIVLLFAGLFVYLVSKPDSIIHKLNHDFRMGRVEAWLDPYSYTSDTSFQNLQALYAIGSGGLFGKGLGNSIQKLTKIPEPYNDFIFAIICEELGILGASLLILMFIYQLYRIYLIARNAEDLFGRMLTTGIFAHIAIQVVMNIAVVTSVIPNTGVTLPFISYGGSALVFLFVEIGMVLSVGKWSELKREENIRIQKFR